MDQELYGGLELGGTKTICVVGDKNGIVTEQITIATASPDETLRTVTDFFELHPIRVLGVGSFGPLDLNLGSPKFGSIYNSPKPGWENVDLKSTLETNLRTKVIIDTDVDCAALGELHFGVARNVANFVYLTIGTGIGGSLVINGAIVHGNSHTEMGHMRIPHEPFDDSFRGVCPYHKDCLEGIASGTAMQARYKTKVEQITDASAWDQEALYLAYALNNILLATSPDLIVLGGGLMRHAGLLESIRLHVRETVGGYVPLPNLDDYIVSSSGDMNGALGAIKLASLDC